MSRDAPRLISGLLLGAVGGSASGAVLGLVVRAVARRALGTTMAWPLLLAGAPVGLVVGASTAAGIALLDILAGVPDPKHLVPTAAALVAALTVPALPLVPLHVHARWRPWSRGTRVVSTAVLGVPLVLSGTALGGWVYLASREQIWPTRPRVIIERCEPSQPVNGQCPPGCSLTCRPPPGCEMCTECYYTPPCIRVIDVPPEP